MIQSEDFDSIQELCEAIGDASTAIPDREDRLKLLRLVEILVVEVGVGGRWMSQRVLWHYGADMKDLL